MPEETPTTPQGTAGTTPQQETPATTPQGTGTAPEGAAPSATPAAPAPANQPADGTPPSGFEDFEKIDPTKLSPENLAVYKSMQAAFTRKMQGLSTVQRNDDDLSKAFGVTPPAPAAPAAPAAVPPAAPAPAVPGFDPRSVPIVPATGQPDFTKMTDEQIVGWIQYDAQVKAGAAATAAVQPHLQRLEGEVSSLKNALQLRDEIAAARSSHADFDTYAPKIAELVRTNPTQYGGLPLEALYRYVAFEDQRQAGRNEAGEDLSKARGENPVHGAAPAAPAPRAAGSFEEAVKMSKQELGYQ